MLYEGNLKLSHEKGKMNYGSPWNLVDVGDIMRNIYYKCDYVKEMLAPNGLLWLNFFEDALCIDVVLLPNLKFFWSCLRIINFFYRKPPEMQLNAKDNQVLFENCD